MTKEAEKEKENAGEPLPIWHNNDKSYTTQILALLKAFLKYACMYLELFTSLISGTGRWSSAGNRCRKLK